MQLAELVVARWLALGAASRAADVGARALTVVDSLLDAERLAALTAQAHRHLGNNSEAARIEEDLSGAYG